MRNYRDANYIHGTIKTRQDNGWQDVDSELETVGAKIDTPYEISIRL